MEYLLFILAGFVGATISAVFGLGTALVLLTVGSFLLPVKEVIALSAVMFAVSTILKTWIFRRQIDWKLVILMSLVSIPFAWLGADLLIWLPDLWIEKLLGAMVLAYLLVSAAGWRIRAGRNTGWILCGSAGYGFMSGLLGSGGLIKALMFREMGLNKEEYVGAMAATAVLATLVKLHVYWADGLLGSQHMMPALGLVGATLVAVPLGRTILGRLKPGHFETGLNFLLATAAIALLL